MSRRSSEPAPQDALSPRSEALLGVMTRTCQRRDARLFELIGARRGHNRIREQILRTVANDHAAGRLAHIADYQDRLHDFGGDAAIRSEIQALAGIGILVLRAGVADRRTRIVQPSKRLMKWYDVELPRFFNELETEIKAARRLKT